MRAEQQDFPLHPADSFAIWDSSGLPDLTLSLLFLGSGNTHVKCSSFTTQFLHMALGLLLSPILKVFSSSVKLVSTAQTLVKSW